MGGKKREEEEQNNSEYGKTDFESANSVFLSIVRGFLSRICYNATGGLFHAYLSVLIYQYMIDSHSDQILLSNLS